MVSRMIAAWLLSVALLVGGAAAATADEGDAERGKAAFDRVCITCHTAEPGKNKIGPSLFGVVGRRSASEPSYSYSTAMKNAHKTWTPEELSEYLAHPQQVVPGTKMVYPGVRDEKQRQDVIAYLETLK